MKAQKKNKIEDLPADRKAKTVKGGAATDQFLKIDGIQGSGSGGGATINKIIKIPGLK